MTKSRPFLLSLLLLTSWPARAWDSAFHTALIQLTRNIDAIPGLADSERSLVLADKAGERCKYRKEKLAKLPLRRVYLDFVCGADDPDAERHFWQNDDHQKRAEQHAVDEFNKAVYAYRKGPYFYAEAANHLGRSIHFVQDLTDFSKELHFWQNGKVRARSRELAKKFLGELWQTGRYPSGLNARVNRMREDLGGDSGPATPADLVRGALAGRDDMANDYKAYLRDRSQEGSRDRKLTEALYVTIGGLIVIQEYWVNLYLRYIGVPERRP